MTATWTFAVPGWWPLLLLLPLVAAVGLWRQRRRAVRLREVLGEREPQLAGRPAHAALRAAAALFALACLALAWLRPVAGVEAGDAAGPDFVVALDVSWSMAAQDVPPSRLAAAVAELERLAPQARGARAGLVAFAGEARLLVPLTTDLTAVTGVAQRLAPGAELRGGTDLGAAIDAAAAALLRAGSRGGSVVVLTDGEDFGGAGRVAAENAAARGVAVHCLGFGTVTGSKIAVDDEGGQTFLRDVDGNEVVSQLEPATLAAMAAAGGGEYGSGAERGSLTALYAEGLVPRARELAVDEVDTALAHRFQWPLLAALLLWMLRLVIPERRP